MQQSKFIYRLVILCTFFFGCTYAMSQDELTIKLASIAVTRDITALDTGSLLPVMPIFKVANYAQPTINLADFKGKFLVLHFWHQYCSYCISAFADLDSLQAKFKNKLVILPVTFQSEQSVETFYTERNSIGKKINLPSIVEDTLLRKMFPHDGDPHEVWIDTNGKIKAITEYRMLTKSTLNKSLTESDFVLPVRNHQFDFDPGKPFLINNNGGPSNAFLSRSIFTKYIDSITNTGLWQHADNEMTRLFLANAAPFDFYKSVYANADTSLKELELDYLNKRIIIEAENAQQFSYWPDEQKTSMEKYDKFLHNHVFCYELILPAGQPLNSAYSFMKEDLDRFFECRSVIENRDISSLALTWDGKNNSMQPRGAGNLVNISEDKRHIKIHNATLASLVTLLNMYFDLPVVTDKTDYAGNADIDIKLEDANNLEAINKALKQYGLKLQPFKANMPMLIIRDK